MRSWLAVYRRRFGLVLRAGFPQLVSVVLAWAMVMTSLPTYAPAQDQGTAREGARDSDFPQRLLPSHLNPPLAATGTRTAEARRARSSSSGSRTAGKAEQLLAQAHDLSLAVAPYHQNAQTSQPTGVRLSVAAIKQMEEKAKDNQQAKR